MTLKAELDPEYGQSCKHGRTDLPPKFRKRWTSSTTRPTGGNLDSAIPSKYWH